MIQSIDSRELQVYKPTSAKRSDPVKATGAGTSADAAVQQSVLAQNKTDRVEISTQGRMALAQSAVLSAEEAPKAKSAAMPLEQASSEAAATAEEGSVASAIVAEAKATLTASAQAATEAAASSETTNLSSLTEQQIKAMVTEGTVTQAEAQAELAKRQAATLAANAASGPQQQALKQYSALQQTQGATVFSHVA